MEKIIIELPTKEIMLTRLEKIFANNADLLGYARKKFFPHILEGAGLVVDQIGVITLLEVSIAKFGNLWWADEFMPLLIGAIVTDAQQAEQVEKFFTESIGRRTTVAPEQPIMPMASLDELLRQCRRR